jgi:hypothetical protein
LTHFFFFIILPFLKIGAFCRPIRRRASQTEKDRVVGKMDVVYLALKKLGFDHVDIEDSLQATVSTDMDAHLDWVNDSYLYFFLLLLFSKLTTFSF